MASENIIMAMVKAGGNRQVCLCINSKAGARLSISRVCVCSEQVRLETPKFLLSEFTVTIWALIVLLS